MQNKEHGSMVLPIIAAGRQKEQHERLCPADKLAAADFRMNSTGTFRFKLDKEKNSRRASD
jgi:hypothetical protein